MLDQHTHLARFAEQRRLAAAISATAIATVAAIRMFVPWPLPGESNSRNAHCFRLCFPTVLSLLCLRDLQDAGSVAVWATCVFQVLACESWAGVHACQNQSQAELANDKKSYIESP